MRLETTIYQQRMHAWNVLYIINYNEARNQTYMSQHGFITNKVTKLNKSIIAK